jgi:8-oxo-dGTP pyrophosphatase MutT (NUDIX family)
MRVRVAGVLVQRGGLLLVEHRKGDSSYWLLPGGGVKLGEKMHESLEREFMEELNLRISVKPLLFVVEAVSDGGEHILQPTFRVAAFDSDQLKLGKDKRVVNFRFCQHDTIDSIIIYPDIKDELKEYLKTGDVSRRYLLKKWLD